MTTDRCVCQIRLLGVRCSRGCDHLHFLRAHAALGKWRGREEKMMSALYKKYADEIDAYQIESAQILLDMVENFAAEAEDQDAA